MVKVFKILLLSLSIITSSSLKCATIAYILGPQLVGLAAGVGSFTGLMLTHELGHALTAKYLFDEDVKIVIGGLLYGHPLSRPKTALTISGFNPTIAYCICDKRIDWDNIKNLENNYKVGAAGPIAGGAGSILLGLLAACSKLRVTTRVGLYISSFASLCLNIQAILPEPEDGSDGDCMQRIKRRIQELKREELALEKANSFEQLKLPPLS